MRLLKNLLELLFWSLVIGVALVMFSLLVGWLLAPFIGYFSFLLIIISIPLIVRIAASVRRRRAASVLSYLQQAVRLNLPLPRFLYAAQRSEHGKTAYRLAILRERIEDGTSLATALQFTAPEVDARELAWIAAGERLGRLPQTMHKLLEQQAAASREQNVDLTFYRIYPALMILGISGVVSFINVFVTPKFQAIFRDFGVPLPALSMNVLVNSGPISISLFMLALLYLAIGAVAMMFEGFRFGHGEPALLRGMLDRALWHLPITHELQRDRGLADACELIAEGLRAAAPIDYALTEASKLQVNTVLAERLAHWAQSVANGAPLSEAARQAWMPRLVWSMLSSVGSGDDAAGVFQFLARYYASRFSRLSALVRGATVPAIVLVFGVLVALVTLGMFLPLIRIIDSIKV
jgi:type II secretory pathway component PulF